MNNELFNELVVSVKEGSTILQGEKEASRTFHLDRLDIKRIRGEQGRRVPEGPAMVLLRVADKHPEAVLDAVRK